MKLVKYLSISAKHMALWIAFMVPIFIVGCSTLNKDECLNADWQTIGFQDGYKGNAQSRIERHRKACAEYGVKPVLDEYLAGYDRGISEYCKPERGYRRGLLGYRNEGLCKGVERKPYNNAYVVGSRIYNLEQQINVNRKSLGVILERNNKLEDKKIFVERKLINNNLTRIQRSRLVNSLHTIDERKRYNIGAIRYHENMIISLTNEAQFLRKDSNY